MSRSRTSSRYIAGMSGFSIATEKEMVKRNARIIQCPCRTCVNNILHHIDTMQDHLLLHGFMVGYTCWTKHGEDVVMGEGNNPGGNIQNSEQGNTDIEYNCMGGMESPQQNAECENPNRSEQKRDCMMPSYDDDDDMPDFMPCLEISRWHMYQGSIRLWLPLRSTPGPICIQDAKGNIPS